MAVADLTAAYARQASSVRRGIALLPGRKTMLVQDEVAAGAPAEVAWFLHTEAQAKMQADGRSAILTQGKQRLLVRLCRLRKAG